MRTVPTLLLTLTLPLLTACGSGDWVVTTWGEEFIEEGIPADEMGDGCSVAFTAFEVELSMAQLLLADETLEAEVPVGRFDLVEPGPQELGRVEVGAGDYNRVYYGISAASEDASRVAGSVTCGEDTVDFDWSFDLGADYRCLPLEISVPKGGEVTTQLTIHGDHLFFDTLEDEGAVPMGQAVVDADADADAVVTMAELEAVAIGELDYPVSTFTEVGNLGDYITTQMQRVGHVDGEGHCYVDLEG